MLTSPTIDRILTTIPNRTVGLIGDLFLDRYFDIDAALNEPSVETGLTAYQVTGVRCYPGALGTVLNNLVALGVGRIHPITVIGDDGEGYELRKALATIPSVDTRDIVVSADRRTPTYNKPMLNEAGQSRELNRLDIKNRMPTPQSAVDDVIARIDAAWESFDAVLVLDQVSEADCGVVTSAVRERLAELGQRDPSKFILADSRERIALFRNVCAKPNAAELGGAVADRTFDHVLWMEREAAAKLSHTTGRPVFATRGEAGILVADGGNGTVVESYPVSGPVDICGAGDSCSAGIACAMTASRTNEEAAAFGNLVASITIQQIGITGTASPSQVRARWIEVSGGK